MRDHVATEIAALHHRQGPHTKTIAPTVAVLMFSTSEKGKAPALDLRQALEGKGLRVYNPRNKVAGRLGPVHDLFGLLSYLIDPVTRAPCGAKGGRVEVWASCGDPGKAGFALTAAPRFAISGGHVAIQKRLRKRDTGTIDAPTVALAPLLDYLDDIRERLVVAATKGRTPRLSLAGLVARMLSFDYFRGVGFTPDLFREALFTTLLESNIAATRRSRTSLDGPLEPTRGPRGKIEWPAQYWQFLNVFGMLLTSTDLDDPEVDAFADRAVAMLTYHQAKGLEFDHIYVGMTGREPAINSVLQTKLFSGDTPRYKVRNGQPTTADRDVLRLAEADRDRELYVALTRAKTGLTFFHGADHEHPLMGLHDQVRALFHRTPRPIRGAPGVVVVEAAT